MNLVSLLIATSVVKYSHNPGLRTGVALGAIAIVVTAIVISKRRSTSVAGGGPAAPAVPAGPDSAQGLPAPASAGGPATGAGTDGETPGQATTANKAG